MAGEAFWLPVSSGGGGSSTYEAGLLARVQHNPAVLATYSIATNVYADVDSTNLAVTFTAPASGKVRVTQEAVVTGGQFCMWSLRSGTTDVTGAGLRVLQNGTQVRVSASRVITGLTSGASYTWKWAFRRDATGTFTMYAGELLGPAIMEVWAVA